ncbi:tRNA glutamyl-Q(34) synthetase GluQRS [Propionibacterium sp. NM47_B9-13]|jgi:glutamyl-tRNA synthetase|uniref:Glutamyl-Q tRNA(Asp) synthetase n=2 Tax=Cutibacterium modestum TaxID=2559073 RepID=A0AAD1KPV9_9ACTN|nr:tRNA glutamyl-Q(34) synthetase GluQRS [Cutibacterium modestum]TGY27289.1 tRNA glutamyl-Q(34) synthetase GluQRS [Propionibacterium sp. NM47_B9-13]AOH45127.1 tRNA glutamyl-Q(34) synthetase GluQRS [Cutibacterium modestum]EFS75235.1 putative glutamyl-queuosine tRNA(Asp) synthetase [Cutibacterium modestum HL037PA2]EFS91102.1 putative glutamyl-queuosine tRNA(Asp) synthetase [Cutibacterium modestum HL044PA1]EFT16824.1 putative glutamyl-queuosine tRNA(Asp) synthetase [Cutibacterium modestum HL037PA
MLVPSLLLLPTLPLVTDFATTHSGSVCPAGRFAPSPTSALHLGNLRTALAAWLLARSTGRRFVVRIEDLDQARVAAAGNIASAQLRDLESLGLDWDGPVIWQSERLDLYADAVAGLETYPCFCTRREIAAAATAPNKADWRPYPGTCRTLDGRQRRARTQTRAPAIRLSSRLDSFEATDLVRGRARGRVDDLVLVRNDGTAAYNLAVVVDDGLQGVDQVVRARDLWASAPRQAQLAELLGFAPPVYAHTGLVTGPGGARLSKSAGAAGLADLADSGIDHHRVVAWLCHSLGLPEVADPHELVNIAALTPPTPVAGIHRLDPGPLPGAMGWWSDAVLDVAALREACRP